MINDAPIQLQAVAGTLITAILLLTLPGLAIAGAIVGYAWWRGWPATRLRNLTAIYAASSVVAGVYGGDPVWPYTTMRLALDQAWSGQWPNAVVNALGAELLLGSVGAWWWWHGYTKRMNSGTEQRAGEKHQKRQRLNRERDARRRSKRELTPMSRDERIILGHRSDDTFPEVRLAGEQLAARHRPWIEVTLEKLRLHLAVIGETGAGKSTLLKRLTAGWTEAAWRRFDQGSSRDLSGSLTGRGVTGSPRPLTIFVEAKGGREAGDAGYDWADTMEAIGIDPKRIGVFPFQNRLNLWQLPAKQLRASLHALAGTDQRYYEVLQRGLLHLVIDAPQDGPPRSSVDFLKRLNKEWLERVWAGHQVELDMIAAIASGPKAGASPLQSDLILFDDLFRSLSGDFDAGRSLADFDALYISLPGTVDGVVAEAKAAVVIELVAHELATSNREALFVLDEFSAVSGELAGEVTNLVERLRSMGGSVVVSSQSYQGLAKDDDERERLLNAMGGGTLVMRTQGAGPIADRLGTRKVGEVGRHLQGAAEDIEGTLRRQDAFTLDPNRVRQLPPYHVAYALPDHVQWGVVTPLDDTKRMPVTSIQKSPQRELPAAGDAIPFLQLTADQRSTVDEQLRGWSA